jgi:hypothetical protein
MLNSVCLLGSAAGCNAGGAALISGIMETIDLRLQHKFLYRIPTLFPRFVEQSYRHNRVEEVNVMPWTGSLKLIGWPTYKGTTGSDLSLVFDAVLFDRSLFNPMFNFLSSFYFRLPAAKKAGIRIQLVSRNWLMRSLLNCSKSVQVTREILARGIPLLQKKAMIAADCVAELDALGG